MSNRFCLAFDVGGTFIKYGVIDESGKIYLKDKIDTPGFPGKETVPKAMIDIYNKIKNDFKIDCIGISTLGQVNTETGIIYGGGNLPGYNETHIVDIIRDKLKIDVFVDNDVNSAAAGELWLGSGKDQKNFLCITLGTGVGGAIVIDSKIHRGANFSAAEVGHFIIIPDGDKCNCGKKGCFERYASTSALIRQYKEELEKNGEKFLDSYDGEYIVEKSKKGDSIARLVYDKFLNYIAYGIANLTHILDLGTVIVGGGISAQGKVFFDEINERFKEFALDIYHKNTIIKQASLENDAGIIGAAFNAFNYCKNTEI